MSLGLRCFDRTRRGEVLAEGGSVPRQLIELGYTVGFARKKRPRYNMAADGKEIGAAESIQAAWVACLICAVVAAMGRFKTASTANVVSEPANKAMQ